MGVLSTSVTYANIPLTPRNIYAFSGHFLYIYIFKFGCFESYFYQYFG